MTMRHRAFTAMTSPSTADICALVLLVVLALACAGCVGVGTEERVGAVGSVVSMPVCEMAEPSRETFRGAHEDESMCARGWRRIDVDGVPSCAPDSAVWGVLPAVPTGISIKQDGTAVHATTGLMWQAHVPDESMLTWSAAFEYCDTLVLAGHQDWRLPTMTELSSISVMFCEQVESGICGEPPLETEKKLWSASLIAGDDPPMALVAGGQSFVLFATKSSVIVGKYSEYGVRCVRGGLALVDRSQHFVVTSPSTAFDKRTGLTWMRCAFAAEVTQAEGRALCGALPIAAGEPAWRLPSARELETLVERDGLSPEVSDVFASTDIEPSRMVAAHPPPSDTVAFRLGTGEIVDACNLAAKGCPTRRRAQCVRGPQM